MTTPAIKDRVTPTEKWCNHCGQWKLHEAFYFSMRRGRLQFSYLCRECRRVKARTGLRRGPHNRYTDSKKWCSDCQGWQPNSAFYRSSRTQSGFGCYCKTHTRIRARVVHLEKLYGLSETDFVALETAQDGVCAICGNTQQSRKSRSGKLEVDHNHTTNEVRGLLCSGCNVGIAQLKESSTLLRAAIEYLANPPARRVLSGKELVIDSPVEVIDATTFGPPAGITVPVAGDCLGNTLQIC